MSVLDEHAKAAYDAFSARRRGYRKLPPWELALELDREAWRAVARAVIDSQAEYVRNRTPLLPQEQLKKLAFGGP